MHESEKWEWSGSVVSNSSQPHGLQPTRLLCPWDFPGKSTGVRCHSLLWIILLSCLNLSPAGSHLRSPTGKTKPLRLACVFVFIFVPSFCWSRPIMKHLWFWTKCLSTFYKGPQPEEHFPLFCLTKDNLFNLYLLCAQLVWATVKKFSLFLSLSYVTFCYFHFTIKETEVQGV